MKVFAAGFARPGALPGPLPLGVAGLASGADQRIAPGLVVQVGDPGLAQGLNGGGCHHPASPSVGRPGGLGGR